VIAFLLSKLSSLRKTIWLFNSKRELQDQQEFCPDDNFLFRKNKKENIFQTNYIQKET